MKNKIVISLIFYGVHSACYASSATPLMFDNDDQLPVSLSYTNPNKILIEDDKIISDKGLKDEYSAEDTEDGGIIILPYEQKTPATIYLHTKFGRSVSLSVSTHKGAGRTYKLMPDSPPKAIANEQAKDWEESQPYVTTLTEIMKAVAKGSAPPEYFEFPITKKNSEPAYQPYSPIRIERKKLWVGSNLSVTEYRMINTSRISVQLQQRYFYMPGVVAVSVSKERLICGEEGKVWIISETSKTDGVAK